jgi:hypothetical protein
MNRIGDFGRLCETRVRIQSARQDRQTGHLERKAFIAGLKREVANLRRGFIAENRAVHAVWFGPTAAEAAQAAKAKKAAETAQAAKAKKAAEAAQAAKAKKAAEAAQAAKAKKEAEAAEAARAEAEAVRVKTAVEAVEATRVKKAMEAAKQEAEAITPTQQ